MSANVYRVVKIIECLRGCIIKHVEPVLFT